MEYLEFIGTNMGVFAVRRHPAAELKYYTQVWRRTGNGEWKKYHYFTQESEAEYTPGLLEAIYQHMDKVGMQQEDWW